MKRVPDRTYTPEFRQSAVSQVIDGKQSVPKVARSMEMSEKTLANWVGKARRGEELAKRVGVQPVTDVQAELSRLRKEVAQLKLEREILKKAAAYFARES